MQRAFWMAVAAALLAACTSGDAGTGTRRGICAALRLENHGVNVPGTQMQGEGEARDSRTDDENIGGGPSVEGDCRRWRRINRFPQRSPDDAGAIGVGGTHRSRILSNIQPAGPGATD